jgi:hypothetical protein
MCWWHGGRFIRNDLPASQWPQYEDLRILAGIILSQISRDGRGMMSAKGNRVMGAWMINHDDRPSLVAILVAMIDETATECRATYPESAQLADMIVKRANNDSFIVEYDPMFSDAPSFVRQVANHLQNNARHAPGGSRHYKLPADLVWRIKIFGDILNEVGTNYAACINHNSHVAIAAGLNLSFSIAYIKTCMGVLL